MKLVIGDLVKFDDVPNIWKVIREISCGFVEVRNIDVPFTQTRLIADDGTLYGRPICEKASIYDTLKVGDYCIIVREGERTEYRAIYLCPHNSSLFDFIYNQHSNMWVFTDAEKVRKVSREEFDKFVTE